MVYGLLLAFIMLIPQMAHASRLWSSGFELNSMTAGVEWDTVTGSPTNDATIKRTGSYSMRCNVSAATAYGVKNTATLGSGPTWYVRFYMYIASMPTGGDCEIFRELVADGVAVQLRTTGTLVRRQVSGGAKIGPESAALSTGQWYRIEVSFNFANVSQLNLDGVMVSSDTVTGISCTSFRVGAGTDGTNSTADLYFDDVAHNDSNGSTQNSFPGSGGIIHLMPDSQGDTLTSVTLGGTSPAATAWQSTDEIPPNDNVDVGSMTATSVVWDSSMTASGIATGSTITLVHVGLRARASSAASCTIAAYIKSQASGTLKPVTGSSTTFAVSTWSTNDDSATTSPYYKLTEYVDPQAGGPWSPALLDTMQVRLKSSDVTPRPQISTIWVLVDYIPAVGGGGTTTITDRRRIVISQ